MLERTPQAFINGCFSLLWNSGYSVSINDNLGNWVDFYLEQNPNGCINAAADPQYHDLNSENSFWLGVHKRGTRDTVACIAERMIYSENFVQDQQNMVIWYGKEAPNKPHLDLALERDQYPDARGLIGHPAGLWVAKTDRHNGLAWMLQRLARAYALVRWPEVGWQCGNTLEPVAARGLPINTYGYTRSDLLVDGWFEPTHLNQKVFMTSISASEMALQIAGDLSLIEMNPKEQVGDFVRTVRERQGHAPVLTSMAA